MLKKKLFFNQALSNLLRIDLLLQYLIFLFDIFELQFVEKTRNK